MPKYDYACRCGLIFESIAGFDDDEMICGRCGQPAKRRGVYREQFISCETGPKGGIKSEPPREEKSYRHEYKRFEEAAQTIDYGYSRNDDPKVKKPRLYERGKARAQAEMARTRGKYRID